jgi:ribosomal peptide maturation radical SAM protein 1
MTRTLLLDTPFSSAYRPQLALSTLQACLREAGHPCDLEYAKLDFARRIGLASYTRIAETLPNQFLTGDFIFSGGLVEDSDDACAVDGFVDLLASRYPGRLPSWLGDELLALRTAAAEFLDEWTERILSGPKYDLIGFSLTFQLAPGLALARRLKMAEAATWTVVGGGYCEGPPGLVLHQCLPWLDFVARGESERLIVQLADSLAEDADPVRLAAIPGLIWREGGLSVANGSRAPNIDCLDDIPCPDYRDWRRQIDASALPLGPEKLLITFETSRGCWYGDRSHCTFCGLNGPSLRFRAKSAPRVLAELQALERQGVPRAEAADLILDMRYFEELLPQLAQRPHGLSLFYETKANLTREHLRLLADAGVDCIQPGIESLSRSTLKLMRKGAAPHHNVRLLKWCAELGIRVHWNLLCGFPQEEPAEYSRMAALIPLLVHLQPPMQGVTPVLMNRFSPLHEQPAFWEIGEVRPVPAYDLLFGELFPDVADIAYFFDFEHAQANDVEQYVTPLATAVRSWRERAGESVYFYIPGNDRIELVDTRPVASARHTTLTGVARDLYLACDGGATRQRLQQDYRWPGAAIDDALERLCNDGHLLDLDGHYLSLAVSADGWLPADTPRLLRRAVAEVIATRRAARLAW